MKKLLTFLIGIIFFLPVVFSQTQEIKIKIADLNGIEIDSVNIYDINNNLLKKNFLSGKELEVPDTTSFLIFEYKNFKKIEFVQGVEELTVLFPFYTSYDEASYELKGKTLGLTKHRDGIFRKKTAAPPVLSIVTESESSYALEIAAEVYDDSDMRNPQPQAGLLTAGEVNDFAKWNLWQDITNNQLKSFIEIWKIYPRNRFTVQVSDTANLPIVNAAVRLYDNQNNLIWAARTDNTGKAELWSNMFDTSDYQKNKMKISVLYQNEVYNINKVRPFKKGINKIELPVTTKYPDTVDIAFVIDITGSMGDELQYLKAEITDIINKVKIKYRKLAYRVAIVVYKDEGDDFVYKYKNFTSDINSANNFLMNFYASGGGDYPEAVHSAMEVAVNKLNWADNARTRLIFLVLDAPPHNEDSVINSLNKTIFNAATKGIKIVPLAASGINKSTEYLLRSMELATGGTYTFLTDDSGIGNSHIKPTTDKYDVKLMHDLFIEIIKRYIEVPPADDSLLIRKNNDIKDTTIIQYDSVKIDTIKKDSVVTNINFEDVIRFFPNPTNGPLTVEIYENITEFYVADITGRLLERHQIIRKQDIYYIDLSKYVNGVYFIQFFKSNKWYTGKVLLIK